MPGLTKEAFLALADQAGIQADASHLDELFIDVQAMFERLALLTQASIAREEPTSLAGLT